MREDNLQEIIELLPYSIRYSGEIKEQQWVFETKPYIKSLEQQNKRYREAKKQIEEKYEYFQDVPSSISTGLSMAIEILDKALEGEE